MRIDAHTHYLSEGLLEALRRRKEPPFVERAANGTELLRSREMTFAFTPEHYDPVVRREFMQRLGLDAQVLSFPAGRGLDILPGAEGVAMVRDYNDHLSAHCRAHPGVFYGVGGLPYADMQAAAAELRRLRGSLGLIGAVVPAGYFRSEAGLDELAPVLDAAEDTGACLMVHPSPRPGDVPPPKFADQAMHRVSTVELFGNLAHVMVTILCSDRLADRRNMVVHVIDLGGAGLVMYERMRQMEAVRERRTIARFERFGQLLFDNSSLGPRALEMAVKVYGADRIMLGTDYPYFPVADSVRALEQADLTAAEREAVESGTACRLLGRYGLAHGRDVSQEGRAA